MASLLQKLLRKQSPNSIITTFNKQSPENLVPPLLSHLHHEPHPVETKPELLNIINLIPFKTGDSISPHSIPIFPSFPFGFSLNPIDSTGFVPTDADDTPTIWADSVKKKRKRKMNKHKYRKLRKRLRRRT